MRRLGAQPQDRAAKKFEAPQGRNRFHTIYSAPAGLRQFLPAVILGLRPKLLHCAPAGLHAAWP
jgi:hypothetical protein